MTTKTREGKGLWEKCNICGLSINRIGIQKNISKKYYNTSYQKNNSLRSGQILSSKSHFEIRKPGAKKIADKLNHYLNSSMSILGPQSKPVQHTDHVGDLTEFVRIFIL